MEAWSTSKNSKTKTKKSGNQINFINSLVYPMKEPKDEDDDDDGVGESSDGKDSDTLKSKCVRDLEQFSQNTTLHGLNFVTGQDSSPARRLAWSVVVISMMVAFVYFGIVNNVLRFLDRPINTIISMNYLDDMDFPAVTICNYNQWKASLVGPDLAQIIFLISSVNTEYPDEETLNYIKAMDDQIDLATDIWNMTHQLEDMLFECNWKNVEPCANDFKAIITEWGVCYTFNNPENLSEVRTVKQSGSNFGLNMRLNVEQYEYILGDNAGAGLRVLVHKQGQLPLVKSLGFSVSPGFESHVGVRNTKVENLEYPYRSNCRRKAIKYWPYTVQTCNYDCYVDFVTEICGCRDYRMPGTARICSAYETITCVKNATSDFITMEKKCDCPTACSADIYDVRVSSTYWPSTYVTNLYLKPLNVSEEEARRNYLDVKIYFEELSFEKVEQIPAYDIPSLLGDIGGFMGLLCGMSLTTLFEFFDFLCCFANKRWRRR